jgi:DNA polymerase III subunit gamma/tau
MEQTKDFNSLYRPSLWSEVKGQTRIIDLLKSQALSRQGLSNGYIFSGKSGVGKTTLVRLFFRCLNSEKLDKNGNPVDETESWKYDLIEVNGSDTRGIDDMREIIKMAQFAPSGRCRGVLIDECHMLSTPAWNCLLKPLEETGIFTVWFFATTNLAKIPKTIQTRCQILKLNPLSWTEIANRLNEVAVKQEIRIDEEVVWAIARHSDNNLRQAIHILEQYAAVGDLKKLLNEEVNVDFLKALTSEKINLPQVWQFFISWDKEYEEFDAFLNAVKYDLSILLKLKLGLQVDVNPYFLKSYQELAPRIKEERLIAILDMILAMQEKVSGVWDYNSMFLKVICQMKNV